MSQSRLTPVAVPASAPAGDVDGPTFFISSNMRRGERQPMASQGEILHEKLAPSRHGATLLLLVLFRGVPAAPGLGLSATASARKLFSFLSASPSPPFSGSRMPTCCSTVNGTARVQSQYSQWYCHRTVTVQSRYSHCTVAVQSLCSHRRTQLQAQRCSEY